MTLVSASEPSSRVLSSEPIAIVSLALSSSTHFLTPEAGTSGEMGLSRGNAPSASSRLDGNCSSPSSMIVRLLDGDAIQPAPI